MYCRNLLYVLLLASHFQLAASEQVFIRLKDVKSNQYIAVTPGTVTDGIGMEYKTNPLEKAGIHTVKLSLKNKMPRRNLLLSCSIHVASKDSLWLIDPRRFETVQRGRIYRNYSRKGPVCGLNGEISLYPFAAMISGDKTYALGAIPDKPAHFRIEYDGQRELLSLNFDIVLIPERPEIELDFCAFEFDPSWKFRSALAKYYELFPEAFKSRAGEHGIWMAFDKISRIADWQDFGFKFKEGAGEENWDSQNGILCFRYWEPSTWWMKMTEDEPRAYDELLKKVNRLAETGDEKALSVLSSAYHDEKDKPVLFFSKQTWCDGAVWNLSPLPGIKGEITCYNRNLKTLKDYDSKDFPFAGEFLDSQEGFMITPMDFRKSNILAAATPLAYAMGSGRACVSKGMSLFECANKTASELHARGKLIMGNDVGVNWWWMAPAFDIMGTESNWHHKGKWQPLTDPEALFTRSMCRGKPFGILQCTDFGTFSREMVEKYMRRCVAYAFFPSFFSGKGKDKRYFRTPILYDRDRELFKKYIPWCKKLSEAGWEPITKAYSNDEKIYIERFGTRYFTVFNDKPEKSQVSLQFDDKNLTSLVEWRTGMKIDAKDGSFELTLEPEGLAILENGGNI